MNRALLASLVTAAVLGTAGGAGYAVVSADDGGTRVQDGATEPGSEGPTGSSGSSGAPPGLFYFLHGTIHDGDEQVRVDGVDADRVVALQHDGDGYLLVSSGDGDDLTGVHVAPGGATSPATVPAEQERLTSPDRATVLVTSPNPDDAPEHPAGGCLAGGPAGSEPAWTQCATGPAAWEPYAPSGGLLLTTTTVGDGPGPSELQVRDAATGVVVHRVDPGGYRLGAAWGADDGTVYAVTGADGTATITLRRCKVATGACTAQLETQGNLVLGSVA